ncbi:Protein-lysine methyltransferase METTL21C [Morella rubra]|uniref:Protein-lysine methyltransferase METTL21C n=1 Tax=Morella rubra TaxID=262757 RepID=A0A6A1VRL1_9ROSI|nr:Protein-lysine methyltransferase METTL21C [Morella rubra]KAB1226301.1 Protein-lysine methyltransferase METTL21C [Morella rubra]
MATLEDDEGNINPTTTILADEQDDAKTVCTVLDGTTDQLTQQHYVRSIDSTVVIRQLPSQGLSFQLWPAATTLVTLLDHHRGHLTNSPLSLTLPDPHRPLNILELGSGTGLVGIAAAATLGANVTVTDLTHVIPNLQFNVDANSDILTLNGGAVDVAPLRWGEANDVKLIGRHFDLILASDVVYHSHLYDPLLETLRFLLLDHEGEKGATVFVMAHLRRWKKDSVFFRKARKLFQVEVLHVDSPSQGCRVGVVVYRFAVKLQKSNAGSLANVSL